MSVEYMRRFATGLGQYEFAEVRSDNFEEFVEGAANLADYVAGSGGEVTPAQAEQNVKSAFGKTTTVSGGGFGAKKSGFGGNQGKQESTPDKIELGKHEGYTITINNGKFGYYANAYNYDTKDKLPNKNLPKGADPADFTLEQAIELWAE